MEGYLGVFGSILRDLSFWTGLGTVALFSHSRFNEKYRDEEELDPPLPNRCFTTRFRFHATSLVYSLIYCISYSALIVIGSIPDLQSVLMDLFGSIGSQEKIGTPAWAAMAVMVGAPTLKPVKQIDQRLRKWLLRFASIPDKARGLADEFILAYANPRATQFDLRAILALSETQLWKVQHLLEETRERLVTSRKSDADDYAEFFRTNNDVVKLIDAKARDLRDDWDKHRDDPDSEPSLPSSVFHRQLVHLVRQHARFIVSAVLQEETGEYTARERLKADGECAALASASFRFGANQLILGALLVFMVCAVSGVTISFYKNGVPQFVGGVFDVVAGWVVWGLATTFALLFPIVLAAAVQLWLLDEEAYQSRGGYRFGFKLVVTLGTLVGCFFLAGAPLFAGEVADAYIDGHPITNWIIFYAFVPASAAVAFIHVSRRRISGGLVTNAAIDFVTIGAVGAAVAIVIDPAVLFAKHALSPETVTTADWVVEVGMRSPSIAALAFLVTGVFGALHCHASRPYVRAARGGVAARGDTVMPVAPHAEAAS